MGKNAKRRKEAKEQEKLKRLGGHDCCNHDGCGHHHHDHDHGHHHHTPVANGPAFSIPKNLSELITER